MDWEDRLGRLEPPDVEIRTRRIGRIENPDILISRRLDSARIFAVHTTGSVAGRSGKTDLSRPSRSVVGRRSNINGIGGARAAENHISAPEDPEGAVTVLHERGIRVLCGCLGSELDHRTPS